MSSESARNVRRLAFSVAESADSIGVTPMTIYRWIKLGLPVMRIGAVTRIEPDALLAWMRSRADADAQKAAE